MKLLIYLLVLLPCVNIIMFYVPFPNFAISGFTVVYFLLSIYFLFKFFVKKENISVNKYMIFYIAWFIYAFFTIFWVQDKEGWIEAVYFISMGMMCVLIFTQMVKSSKETLLLLKIIIFPVILHNIIGWIEVLTGNYLFLPPEHAYTFATLQMPVSSFYNSNSFALFMLFGFFVAFICAVSTKSIVWKVIYFITMGSSALLIYFSDARSCLLGLVIGITAIAFLNFKWENFPKIIVTTVILFSTFIIIAIINPEIITSMWMKLSESLQFDFVDAGSSESLRLNAIKNGLVFLLATLGIGVGAGNVEYWLSTYSIYPMSGVGSMHNWWMEILVAYGIFIFLWYVMIYVFQIRDLYRGFCKGQKNIDTNISLGFIGWMFAFIIGSISPGTLIDFEWLWVSWGIIISFILNLKSNMSIENVDYSSQDNRF